MVSRADKMRAAAARAVAASPSIADRIAHAKSFVDANPVANADLQPPASVAPSHEVGMLMPSGEGGGIYQEIDVEKIYPNPYNARKVYRPERVQELAASIATHGQETPGIATIRDGKVILVAGHYRQRALRLANVKKMKLIIREGLTNRQLYEMSYRENAERDEQSPLDNALSWRDLLEQGVYANETEIAEATGASLPNVNKTMAALKLSDAVMEAVLEAPNLFGISILYEVVLFEQTVRSNLALTQDKADEATLDIVRAVRAGEISRAGIQAAREKYAQPNRPRKKKETARSYKIQHGNADIGALKEWDSGRILLDLVYKNPDERAAIVEELKSKFGLN